MKNLNEGSEPEERKDGPSESYHRNGQLSEKGNYLNGQKEGSWEYYYDNGQLRKMETYNAGIIIDGYWECYDYDGHFDENGN